jgi:hypothetical protein
MTSIFLKIGEENYKNLKNLLDGFKNLNKVSVDTFGNYAISAKKHSELAYDVQIQLRDPESEYSVVINQSDELMRPEEVVRGLDRLFRKIDFEYSSKWSAVNTAQAPLSIVNAYLSGSYCNFLNKLNPGNNAVKPSKTPIIGDLSDRVFDKKYK